MTGQATYRKARDNELWHFCMNCGDWPAKEFEELSSAQNQPRERICAECTELQRRELCQSSDEVAP
jgi:hypothetical protein